MPLRRLHKSDTASCRTRYDEHDDAVKLFLKDLVAAQLLFTRYPRLAELHTRPLLDQR